MKLSQQGADAIKAYEGFSLRAYPDPGTGGKPYTIGWGTTRYPDGDLVRPGDEITHERARLAFDHDVQEFEDAVNRLVTVPITQSQFDALVSFAYNVGIGALSGSTLLHKLNSGDTAGAANEFLRWNRTGGQVLTGLRRRREAERARFLSDADSAPIPPLSAPPIDAPTKPMAPILAALLPTVINLIPELGKLLGSGSDVATRNVEVAQRVAEVVVQATNAPNLQGAVEAIQRDPEALSAASDAIRREWFDLAERSIAHRQDFALRYAAQQGVRTVFGSGLTFVEFLSLLLVVNGMVAGGYILYNQAEFGAQIVGSVIALMIVGGFIGSKDFWLGTSSESRRKTDLLAEK